jgi:hypothetical protein
MYIRYIYMYICIDRYECKHAYAAKRGQQSAINLVQHEFTHTRAHTHAYTYTHIHTCTDIHTCKCKYMQVLQGEGDEVVSIVRSVSLGAEVHIKQNSCCVVSGPRVGMSIKSEGEEDSVGAIDWSERARTVHEAVMEQLVEV